MRPYNVLNREDATFQSIRVSNGSFAEGGHQTIPSEAMVSWLAGWIQSFGSWGAGRTIFDESPDGFSEYCTIQYRNLVNFISLNWEYSQDFLDDLGLDKYDIDIMLIQNGTLAFVKFNESFYVVPYETETVNVYAKPTKIKCNFTHAGDDAQLDNISFEEEQFVIIDNDPTQWNIIIKNYPWFAMMYKADCEIWDGIYGFSTHWANVEDPDWRSGTDHALPLSELMKSRQKVFTYLSKVKEGRGIQGDLQWWEKFKNSLLPLESQERLTVLWETHYNAEQECFKAIGAVVNSNQAKNQQQISTEISSQQSIPTGNRKAMFGKRKAALDKINKLFSKSYSITENKEVLPPENNANSSQGGRQEAKNNEGKNN